jgi:hypothetical protein
VELVEVLFAAPIRSETDIARVFRGLRQEEQILHWLEVGVESKSLHLLGAVASGRFEWRRAARFQAILTRIGFQ